MKSNMKCIDGKDEDGIIGSESRNSVILSLSFMFVFMAFNSIQNLQSSLNQDQGLGVISLSCLYGCVILSSIYAPTVIKVIGIKLAIIIPWIVHVVYTLSNFYPTFATLISSSILLGLVAGFLWTAQASFLSTNSASLAKTKNIEMHVVLSKLNGIFFTMYESTQITGNLISSLVLNQGSYNEINGSTKTCGSNDCPLSVNATKIVEPDKNIVYTLLGIYLSFDILGMLLTAFFLPPLPRSEWVQRQTIKTSISSCFSTLGDIKLVLLVPLIVFMAMEQAILFTDFTKSYISCPFGIDKVGFVMAAYGGATAVAALIWSRLAKFTGRYVLFATASSLNMGIFITLYIWTPDQEYYLFVIVIMWGISEGIWQTQSNALMTLLFLEKIEPVFANYHGWKAIGLTTSFVTSNFLCVSSKLIIAMTLLCVAMILYVVVEVMETKKVNQKQEYNIVDIKQDNTFSQSPIDHEKIVTNS